MCWDEQEIRQRGTEYKKRYYDMMKLERSPSVAP